MDSKATNGGVYDLITCHCGAKPGFWWASPSDMPKSACEATPAPAPSPRNFPRLTSLSTVPSLAGPAGLPAPAFTMTASNCGVCHAACTALSNGTLTSSSTDSRNASSAPGHAGRACAPAIYFVGFETKQLFLYLPYSSPLL